MGLVLDLWSGRYLCCPSPPSHTILLPTHARRRRCSSSRCRAIPFERSVPVAGDNYRHLERAGDWVHPTGGPASTALGRGGDLGRRHSHVHASSPGHGLASVGSQEGALLGARIGRGRCEKKQLTALIMREEANFVFIRVDNKWPGISGTTAGRYRLRRAPAAIRSWREEGGGRGLTSGWCDDFCCTPLLVGGDVIRAPWGVFFFYV